MEMENTIEQRGTNPRPLVSIVVVVFEALPELSAVVQSILPQKNEDVELIVIDGGSQDGTVEFLKAHNDQIDYWISEPDKGIYDAMNKAVAKAHGAYLLHLNAGDRLLQIPRETLLQSLRDGIEVAAFRVSFDGRPEFKPSTGPKLWFTNTLHHQGTFFKREIYLNYDLRYRTFADFDVNQKLGKSGAKMKAYPAVVAFHANDGVSNQDNDQTEAEFLSVVRANHGQWAVPVAWFIRKWNGLRIMLNF